eukprot:EC713857.1.p1 GENE.EC713857.1~~EC713857.1.p1  ORF type:complete len:83 (+),score=14.11 EC713857.1:228-476(+)
MCVRACVCVCVCVCVCMCVCLAQWMLLFYEQHVVFIPACGVVACACGCGMCMKVYSVHRKKIIVIGCNPKLLGEGPVGIVCV